MLVDCYLETEQLEFNITTDTRFDAKVLLIVAGQREEPRKALRGEIRVLRGTIFQTSDVDVRMIVRTNNESEVYIVGPYRVGSILGVSYAYTGDPDLCTQVQVLIFLRPYPSRVLDFLVVFSRIFDISIHRTVVKLGVQQSFDGYALRRDNVQLQQRPGDADYPQPQPDIQRRLYRQMLFCRGNPSAE
jgi:hypothetical protein